MTTQAWLVFTSAQRIEVMTLSENTDFKIRPRAIDNPLVANMGDAVVVAGNSVAPARILTDPEYAPAWAGTLVFDLPIRVLDSDILFLPPEE